MSVANVVYLFSYSVRDILWLRILTVAGATLLMPYYYFQAAPLWAPIGWNIVFIAINIFWITKLALDRRPVPFTDEERRIYQLAFRNIREREAFRLFRTGTWSVVPTGTKLLSQGDAVEHLTVIVDGQVDVEMDGNVVDSLGKGRFLGGAAFLNRGKDYTAPVTVTAREENRVIAWRFAELEALFEKDLPLEVDIEASLGLELSRFLQTARARLV
ncbi:cyclic nucleotide-binding domain-containing protein [Hoeflea prorocentri]|uniref:Cyclic nucleotide-binding domain-containing protein n=1 Tax=Hoeflea prorocentri TaxID=1922333 RepID=A0A9X3UFW7_9HYPH|nr:cyclic nucleotide-binding domain-containing protein [Hoeflea prorocentri]MCY6380522.1 cyclic nucleotide-binding domain-containing protein [Hoeflea prorocentri]MDA5398322.1 cyclic nucleotide-binding domain-containing protein [Hoeflea prorocentri]